jgi:hypothetical protein
MSRYAVCQDGTSVSSCLVAKRKGDPYSPQTVWYKVKNPAYTQAEGRGDLFHNALKIQALGSLIELPPMLLHSQDARERRARKPPRLLRRGLKC